MNKYFVLCIIGLLFVSEGSGQIEIKSFGSGTMIKVSDKISFPAVATAVLKNGRIETADEMIIECTNLNLANITLKAKKIIIKNTVAIINVDGNVKFEAETLELEAGGATPEIKTTGPGTLLFRFIQLSSTKQFNFTPINGYNITPRFEKVSVL